MRRTCIVCRAHFEAKRRDAATCSATCRSNRRNGAARTNIVETPLVRATKAELEAAGKLDTRLGQQALILAARMSGTQTAAGVGTLSKELDRVVAAAVGAIAAAKPASSKGDDVDELRTRRDNKRAS
jgi:hypothetical protein